MLPNVLCIGIQKAGTTYLASLLRQHPDVFLPKQKEVHYFSNVKNYSLGINYYKKYFKNVKEEKVIFEATPRYIIDEKYIKRIKNDLNDNIKIIIIMREPISRLISHYKMKYSKRYEQYSLNKVISDCLKEQTNNYSDYIKRGLYADQIEMVLKYFNKDQVYLMIFEEFIKNPNIELEKLLKFLKINSKFDFKFDIAKNENKGNIKTILGKAYFLIPFRIRHKLFKYLPHKWHDSKNKYLFKKTENGQTEQIQPELLKNLRDIYGEQINKLENLYKLDLQQWKK